MREPPQAYSRYYLFRGDEVVHTCTGSAGGAHERGQHGDVLIVMPPNEGICGFLWRPSKNLHDPCWDMLTDVDPRYQVLALLQT